MKLLSTTLLSALLTSSLFAAPHADDVAFTPSNNKTLAVTYTFDKKDSLFDEEFYEFTKKDLQKIGLNLNDPHHNVNAVYETNFGKTYLDTLSFNSVIAEELIRPMLNIDPRMGAFTPFNLHYYRTKKDMQTVIAHLTPEAMLDILEITDQDIRAKFIASFPLLDETIEKKFPKGKKEIIELQGFAEDTMMNFEIPFDEPEDVDDFLDEFQEKFESLFALEGYIIAGYYNLKDSYNSEEDVLEQYTVFWSYDLCHIPFSYEVFDGPNALPMAGIFAPCSVYMYVKEGENKIVFGMPTLAAWGAAFGVKDKHQIAKMKYLDVDITKLMKSLGAIETPNGNPLLRK